MVSSIEGSGMGIEKLLAQTYQKFNAADVDGASGLSRAELASISSEGNSTQDKFIDLLIDQFSELDLNSDNQLSKKEIAEVEAFNMGPPAGFKLESAGADNMFNDFKERAGEFSKALLKQVMNSYSSNGLSSILSSLNISV